MNIIDIWDFLKKIAGDSLSASGDILRLTNPANIGPVFKDLKVKSANFLRAYILAITLPLFFGYYYYLSTSQANPYSIGMSFTLALIIYLTAASLPMVMAYLLYLFDVRLVKRKVPYPEALTIVTYALGPGILGGIFRSSMNMLPDTWILHLLLIIYSIILVYAALGVRFGYEKIIMPFMFLILAGFAMAIILINILMAAFMIPEGYKPF